MNNRKLLILLVMMVMILIPSASIANMNKETPAPSKCETVAFVDEEKATITPRYEECACGGRIMTKLDSESSWGKGRVAICRHGLNGNVWEKLQTYKKICNTCGYGSFYTETVTEIRCSH